MPGDDNRFATGEGIEGAVVDATKIAILLFHSASRSDFRKDPQRSRGKCACL
jgi:hypothetical protein